MQHHPWRGPRPPSLRANARYFVTVQHSLTGGDRVVVTGPFGHGIKQKAQKLETSSFNTRAGEPSGCITLLESDAVLSSKFCVPKRLEGVQHFRRQPGLVADVEPVGGLATLPSSTADQVQSAEGRGEFGIATSVRVVHRQHDGEVTLRTTSDGVRETRSASSGTNTLLPHPRVTTPASVKRGAAHLENINPATPEEPEIPFAFQCSSHNDSGSSRYGSSPSLPSTVSPKECECIRIHVTFRDTP